MVSIEKKFRESVRKDDLLKKGSTVVVGVSGGPDSVALLYLLNEISPEYRLCLHVAHLDHGLRTASAQDALFVRALGRKLGLAVTCAKARLKTASLKGSLEEAARKARFDFLFGVAARAGARSIALGHNLDDQAETVLMRVLRGTGLYGLSAIIPKRVIGGYTIIRPLLAVPRSEIEAFIRARRLRVRRDPSNDDPVFTRNKLRTALIPFLERNYCASIKQQLARLAESAGTDYDYIHAQAVKLAAGSKTRFSLAKLARSHSALRRILLREAVSSLKGSTRRLTFAHILEIEDMLRNRPVNSIVDLPQGVSCRKTKASLYFYNRQEKRGQATFLTPVLVKQKK